MAPDEKLKPEDFPQSAGNDCRWGSLVMGYRMPSAPYRHPMNDGPSSPPCWGRFFSRGCPLHFPPSR
jgi:hypothetical protein